MPPQSLAALQPGQVIERDRVIRTRVVVSQIQPGFVTLSEIGTHHRIDCSYDRQSGMLVAMNLSRQNHLATTTQSFRLVGRQ